MGRALWFYGWGTYDKVSCCFIWKYVQKIAGLECKAHSHLHSECEAHSHLNSKCEAHSHLHSKYVVFDENWIRLIITFTE